MKKTGILALASLLSAAALSGCGDAKIEAKNVKGGTSEERDMIQTVVNGAILVTGGGTTILPTSNLELSDSDIGLSYVLLSTSQKKQGLTVKMEWEAIASGCSYELIDVDANHKFVDITFPEHGGSDGTITFSLKKISCGGASSDKPELSYPCKVKAQPFLHEDKKISELNKVVHGPFQAKDKTGKVVQTLDDGYDIVDYSKNNPYFKTNNPDAPEKNYYYVNTPGKIIYNTPDGNWGLIADGDQVMEYYAGAAYNLNEKTFPAMIDNKYVSISGNMGHYLGNIQIGFITDMKKIDKSTITEPTMNFQEVTSSLITDYLKNEFGGHKQCVYGANLSNALWKLSGTYVKDSCRVDGGKTFSSNVAVGKRFTFQVLLDGGEKVTVAYDYHVCKADNAPKDMFNTLKALVQSNAEQEVNIKGTLRYVAADSNAFYQTESVPGQWTLVPFDATHVVVGA